MSLRSFLLLLSLWGVVECAAENDFERLKAAADEKSLPLVNMTVDIAAVNKPDYTPGKLEIFDMQERTGGQRIVEFGCEVKYRGATSLAHDKKSFAVRPLDSNGEKMDVDIFGIREDDNWILDAMAIDRLRMRNRVCFDVWNAINRLPYETDYAGRNGTEGVFVELFINGDYHGLYCMTDKINRKLLGLKKVKEDDGSVIVRGLLYKGDSWTDATNLDGYDKNEPMDGETWNGWELQYPDDYPSTEAWQPIADFIDFYTEPVATFAENYEEHVNRANLVDYAVFVLSMYYGDCMMKNTFLSTVNINDSRQFVVTPWDMDMSLGGTHDGLYNDNVAPITLISDKRLFSALWNKDIDGFRKALADRWAELSKTVLSVESINRRIDDYASSFVQSGAWQREYEKWNGNPRELKEDIAEETGYVKGWYARNYKNMFEILGLKGAGISPTGSPGVTVKKMQDGVLLIAGAESLTCEIYTVDGILAGRREGMAPTEVFSLVPNRLYIVRLSNGYCCKVVL